MSDRGLITHVCQVCCAEGSGPSQFVMEWLKAWKARRKQHHSHDHRDGCVDQAPPSLVLRLPRASLC